MKKNILKILTGLFAVIAFNQIAFAEHIAANDQIGLNKGQEEVQSGGGFEGAYSGSPHLVSDEEIVSILIALDASEVAAANLALTKGLRYRVHKYAVMLRDHHRRHQELSFRLAANLNLSLMETSVGLSLRAKVDDELANLAILNGREFERAFVAMAIRSHAEAIDMLDRLLIPSGRHIDVRQFLQFTRFDIGEHLDKAKRLE